MNYLVMFPVLRSQSHEDAISRIIYFNDTAGAAK
jgi:hypothetical protein